MKFLFKPLIAVIVCTFALFLSIVSGCTNIAPPDEVEIDYSIGDWNDGEIMKAILTVCAI